MGQNLENVLNFCEKDYHWNREETSCAIDEAKIKSVIREVIVDGKISFRRLDQEVIFRGKESLQQAKQRRQILQLTSLITQKMWMTP